MFVIPSCLRTLSLIGSAIASPNASRGWILIDLLEERGLTGDDHIPIIDCMKICCGEGKKECFLDCSSVSVIAFRESELDNKKLLNFRNL
jgi:hypothetical protein